MIHPETTLLTHVDRLGKCWVVLWGEESRQAVAYENLETFENAPSDYIVDWATSELEDFSPMALQHAVQEFYAAYGTKEEKRAYGIDVRPHSVCIDCGRLIHFEDGDWYDGEDDQALEVKPCCDATSVPGNNYPHRPRWLTMGEFRELTKHLPDTFPITADAQGEESLPASWYNLRLVDVPTTEVLERDQPASLLLDLRDDFDTRQW